MLRAPTLETLLVENMPSESGVPLSRDKSFWGMATAQFLGAFNDNLFKQLVLLLCVSFGIQAERAIKEQQAIEEANQVQQAVDANDQEKADDEEESAPDYAPYALAIFAIPFVVFSGFAGFLSDRNSKRTIVVLCKVLEIVIMLAGMVAFLMGNLDPESRLYFLFIVLFMMSTQSAFFGPSKYGVLPELFAKKDLPAANGLFQMTTFVAIIFGMAMAGYALDTLGEEGLWIASLICVGIAALGTCCSLFVRKTAIAQPNLKFQADVMFVSGSTARMLQSDKPLLIVLLTSTLFWFLGGIIQPAVNDLGRLTLHLSNTRTSLMAACMGIGIAVGCALAGKLANERTRFQVVRAGAWGLATALAFVAIFALVDVIPGADPPPAIEAAGAEGDQVADAQNEQPADGADAPANQETLLDVILPASWKEGLCRTTLIGLGVAAGLFIVPLQVFMQSRPPEQQKGRMIGTMNLCNWIGIVLSAVLLGVANSALEDIGLSRVWLFVVLGCLVIPVAVFFRPETMLARESTSQTTKCPMCGAEKTSAESKCENCGEGLSSDSDEPVTTERSGE